LMEAVGGTLAFGEEELLARQATDLLVGAMTFEHLLDRLTDRAVVITPGDRVDILIGLLAAHSASGFPSLGGVILNGGYFPPESTARLVA
ncbi:DRTGG domain-containing protein, partial [Bacillus velezensis]|uniref:DRTGG domain-containing protein n=1 Tax=Bacillus velezensis TaxID=492670 RepID=UPI003977C85F